MECEHQGWELHQARDLKQLASLRVGDALRNRWLLQISRVWQQAVLTYFPRSKLRQPQFAIDTARRRWGYWHGPRRVLGISERLLACYSWLDVEETVKHELAHQVVDEVHAVTELPHGDCFQRVCAGMGLAGVASASPSSLRASDPERDPVLAKVRKLLKLGDSSNEHEARLAIRRAHSLLLKHNLSLLQASRPQTYVLRQCGPVRKRIDAQHMKVSNLLSEFFFVEVIWTHCYDTGRDVRGRALALVGRPDAVRLAQHVFAFLYASLERLWKQHKRSQGLRRNRDRKNFQRGVLDGFQKQLAEQREGDAERGLVWLGDAQLGRFYRQRFPHIRTRRTRSTIDANDAYHAGREEGLKLRLRRPVESGHGNRGLALEG